VFFIWVSIPVRVQVTLSRENTSKNIELSDDSTAEKLIEKLGLRPDNVIIMNNDTPIPFDEKLSNGQNLTIIEVSSGG